MLLNRPQKLLLGAAIFAGVLPIGCDSCFDYKTSSDLHVLDASDWYYELTTPAANKDCHARFRLEMMWNNLERRRDPLARSPFIGTGDLRYEFRSSGGTFTPFQFGPLRDSSAGGTPGQWNYFWYWTDDVGAKSEPANPTFYEIRVSAPGLELVTPPPDKLNWWQMVVRPSIEYVLWEP